MVGSGGKRAGNVGAASSLSTKLIKLMFFVGITGVLLYSLLSLVPPQYRSVTTLHIEGQAGSSAKLVTRELKALGSTPMVQSFLDQHRRAKGLGLSKSSLQKSPFALVLSSLGIMDDPELISNDQHRLEVFKGNLSINRGSAAQTIEIAMRSGDLEAAARLANLYAQYYIAGLEAQNAPHLSSVANDEQAVLIDRLRDEISGNETKLAALRLEISDHPFVKSSQPHESLPSAPVNEFRGEESVTLSLEQLSQLTAQLILAKADREQAELRAKLVHDMLKANGRIKSTNNVLNTGVAQKLLLKRTRMEQKLNELSLAMLPSHPQVRRLKRSLATLHLEIEVETKKAVADLDNDVLVAAARENSLRSSLAKLKNPPVSAKEISSVLRGDPASVLQPATVDPRLAQRDEIKTLIAKSQRELLVAQARMKTPATNGEPNIKRALSAKVISPATANSLPVFPKKKPMTLIGMLAAFALGLIGLLLTGRGHHNAPLERETKLRQQPVKSGSEGLFATRKDLDPDQGRGRNRSGGKESSGVVAVKPLKA